MSNLEHELARLRRRPPSPALDARVARSLAEAAPLLARPVPAWACAAAALVGILAGLLGTHPPGAGRLVAEPVPVLSPQEAAAANAFPFFGRRFVDATRE